MKIKDILEKMLQSLKDRYLLCTGWSVSHNRSRETTDLHY